MVHLISVKVRELGECIRPAQSAENVQQRTATNAPGEIQKEITQSQPTANRNAASFNAMHCSPAAQENTAMPDLVPSADENGENDVTYQQENGNSETFAPGERWRIWKNVLALGFAFMLHFTAFWGASNLQSSINADESLGTFTLAAIYGSLLVSNIFLPVIVIKYLGCKWTSSLSLITYMPFIMAQFYPRFYTMIPAGLAVGLGGGPLWCAKCTYLTVVADAYSQIVGVASDVIVTRFFGVFFMFYQFSQVWGNLISSAVLSTSVDTMDIFNTTSLKPLENLHPVILNNTQMDEQTENVCGANFHPSRVVPAENPNLAPPPMAKIHLIAGIYLACMVVACLIIAIFVDSLSRYNKGRKGSGGGLSGVRLLAVTMRQLGNPYQLLILPITMFIGAEQAFLAADYTASFVSCGWGIQNIGYVMICFGVCNAIAAICTGSIVKLTGRLPVVIFALIVHVALILILQFWEPNSTNTSIYFVIAGFWGLADAIWLVQINSLYGILFPKCEEASYSNFRLWESTGSVITYAYNPYLSSRIKIYLLLGLLLIGFTGYAIVEYLERDNRDRNQRILAEKNKFQLVKAQEMDKRKKREIAQ